jgi:site-specific DNA-methyltransferase (adenine-specific)
VKLPTLCVGDQLPALPACTGVLLAKGNVAPPVVPVSYMQEFRYSRNPLHPTKKPVLALIPLIKGFSRKGDLVASSFCGSASTRVPALLAGRSLLGIELDEKYRRVATSRVARVQANLAAGQSIPLIKPST